MKNTAIYLIIVTMLVMVACDNDVRVTGVMLDEREITMNFGESRLLRATVLPANAAEKTVYWSSSNSNMVSVSSRGQITALAASNNNSRERSATIRVSTMEGEFEDFCLVTIVGFPVITIISQPAATTNLFQGHIIGSLAVEASVTEDATLNYQWYINTTHSNTGGAVIQGATEAIFTIPTNLTVSGNRYYFFCEIHAMDRVSVVRTNVATVNVAHGIIITSQPAAITNVTAGGITGSLNVSASVTTGANPTYQWYRNTTDSNTGGTLISGATAASYTIPTNLTASGSPYYYFCEVRASGLTTVRSNVARVNVVP